MKFSSAIQSPIIAKMVTRDYDSEPKYKPKKTQITTSRLFRTSLLYQTREFFNNSTLHGVRYIAETGRPFGERFMWFCFTIIGFISALVIIVSLWEKFQTNPTITGEHECWTITWIELEFESPFLWTRSGYGCAQSAFNISDCRRVSTSTIRCESNVWPGLFIFGVRMYNAAHYNFHFQWIFILRLRFAVDTKKMRSKYLNHFWRHCPKWRMKICKTLSTSAEILARMQFIDVPWRRSHSDRWFSRWPQSFEIEIRQFVLFVRIVIEVSDLVSRRCIFQTGAIYIRILLSVKTSARHLKRWSNHFARDPLTRSVNRLPNTYSYIPHRKPYDVILQESNRNR